MKYHNKRVTVDGIKFDSLKEAARYQELMMLQKAGKISNLELQKSFPFKLNGVSICSYRCDFQYTENNKTIVEDVKGFLTQTYRIKRKLIRAFYGIDIKET